LPLDTLSIGGTRVEGLSGRVSQSIFSICQHSFSFYIIVLGNDIKITSLYSSLRLSTKRPHWCCSYRFEYCIVCSYIANYACTSNLLSYCVRSIMLLRMISLASGEKSYCSKITLGSLISSFLNSGSLAALRSTSLIISASFCC
jgi:hypothetical protein